MIGEGEPAELDPYLFLSGNMVVLAIQRLKSGIVGPPANVAILTYRGREWFYCRHSNSGDGHVRQLSIERIAHFRDRDTPVSGL
jgi:hypothetical protein